MPVDESAEKHVLACCLIDEGHSLNRAISGGLTPASFSLPANEKIFATLLRLAKSGQSIGLETLVPELGDKFEGGMPYIMEVAAEATTTSHVGYMISRVRSLGKRRELIRSATGLLEQAYGDTDLPTLRQRVEDTANGLSDVSVLPDARPITSYEYPKQGDPNVLLGNEDYLGRGGGFLFVSHAGAGKSSWVMDACMMWALGRSWMGIRAHGPLRSLIIQAEDSDRYIGKIFSSFAFVNKLTETETKTMGENCVIVRLKGVCGEDFNRALASLAAKHKPDLVIINPVYLYAEGDISRSEFAQPFLVGLDRVNKEEKFAYILVHHTAKPAAKGPNGKRAETEDWESTYMGFGSSYFANWPRASALLEPVPSSAGHFLIKLGKGGLNAGVTKDVPNGVGFRKEPVTRIAICHSTSRMPVGGEDKPVYYWEIDATQPENPDESESGEEEEEEDDEFTIEMLKHYPATNNEPESYASCLRLAKELQRVTSIGFDNARRELLKRGLITLTDDQRYIRTDAGEMVLGG